MSKIILSVRCSSKYSVLKKKIASIMKIHQLPSLEKIVLRENWINVTVLMIQLTQNSSTCAYIGQNLCKWKPRLWKSLGVIEYNLSDVFLKVVINRILSSQSLYNPGVTFWFSLFLWHHRSLIVRYLGLFQIASG